MNTVLKILPFIIIPITSNAITLQPDGNVRVPIHTEESVKNPALVLLIKIVDSNNEPVNGNIFLQNELICENSNTTTLMLPPKGIELTLEVKAEGYNVWKVELNYSVNNYAEQHLLVQLTK